MKPFAHQRKSIAHAKKNDVVFDTSDAGTGKTGVAIWSFQATHKKTGKCALVLAPKSLLRNAWYNDFKKFAPELEVSVATAANRASAFLDEADVYVTNIDAATWLAKQPKHFFAKFDTLIMDESTAFKHMTSARSKAMAKIAKHFKYRRALTATPNGRSITDVWHQVYLLDGGKRLGSSFYAFRNAVCEPVQKGRHAQALEWVDKDGSEAAVYNLISDITIRHKLEDCVDMPEHHRYEIEYILPPAHRKVYDEMQKKQIAILKNQKMVTAINAASVATKLLQIASGAVYGDGKEAQLVDDGRYELVLDLVEARECCLVFFNWQHQRDALVAEADKRGLEFCVIDGSTSDLERSMFVTGYQAGKYKVMFAHPQAAGHGLTLTRGTTTIWASPTSNAELFEQGCRRQYRIGQKKRTEVITVIAPNTIDERVYFDLLQPKEARMKTLLDLFAS